MMRCLARRSSASSFSAQPCEPAAAAEHGICLGLQVRQCQGGSGSTLNKNAYHAAAKEPPSFFWLVGSGTVQFGNSLNSHGIIISPSNLPGMTTMRRQAGCPLRSRCLEQQ